MNSSGGMSGMNMSPGTGHATHSWLSLGHIGLIISLAIALFYAVLLLKRNQVAKVCSCTTDNCDCYVAHCDCYVKSFHGIMALGMAFMFASLSVIPWIYGTVLFVAMGTFFVMRILWPAIRPHHFRMKYDVVHMTLAFSMAFMFSPLIASKNWRIVSGIFLASFIVFTVFYAWQSMRAVSSKLGNSIRRLEIGTHLAHVAMVVLMGWMIVVAI
jgi:hypothetical protein